MLEARLFEQGRWRFPDDCWREIAETVGKEKAFCRKLGKNLCDWFIHAKTHTNLVFSWRKHAKNPLCVFILLGLLPVVFFTFFSALSLMVPVSVQMFLTGFGHERCSLEKKLYLMLKEVICNLLLGNNVVASLWFGLRPSCPGSSPLRWKMWRD